MRNMVLFFGMLVCALALASAQGYIGRVDTIGGTTYDWWSNAGASKLLVNSPQFGIHAAWMYSTLTSGTTFPDRDMRYNFYDYATRHWNWIDPDHMQDGVNVFPARAGYGSMDADSTGRVYIVASTSSGLELARDVAPGAAIFDYSTGPAGCLWPALAIGDDGTCHIATSTAAYVLCYTRVRTGSGWDSVRVLASITFPAYAIAASRTTPLVCVAWVGDPQMFYLLSENRGDTWSSPIELEPPPAFGGDTVTAFSYFGMFAFIDRQTRLHFVAAVRPVVHDTGYFNPSEIWHWCGQNNPVWNRIHRAGCAPEHMQAGVGYNATYAGRPSIGEGSDGQLYVAWEQFDSSNVEPLTSRLRAGIWLSGSPDNGMTWMPGMLVTERNTLSHRFPSIVDRMVSGGPSGDTVCVLYLMDSVAGFFVQGEGPGTSNPVVCQFIPSPLVGTEEVAGCGLRVSSSATFVRGVLLLDGDCPRTGTVPKAVLLDISGRKMLDLRPGANDVHSLAPGVYFVRGRSAVHKVVVTR